MKFIILFILSLIVFSSCSMNLKRQSYYLTTVYQQTDSNGIMQPCLTRNNFEADINKYHVGDTILGRTKDQIVIRVETSTEE